MADALWSARVATFTTLDDDDARAIADAMQLGALDSWRPIAAGTINSNFTFLTARGRFFVRVNEGKTRDDVAWEAELVAHVAAAGVPTPVPLPAPGGLRFLDHRGLLISVFVWQPGHHRAPHQVTTDSARGLGEVLADLHTAAATRPPSTWREGIYQFADIVRRFDGLRGNTDPALAHALAILDDELAWLERMAPVRAAASHGLIHGDLFRDNVLFDNGHLVAVLDFEQASRGSHIYDLAVTLNDWCWDAAPRRELAHALCAGYASRRPLTAADRAALLVELRAAAARFTVTRITDVYLRQVDNPEKDFRAFLARLEAWRAGALGDLSSSV